MKLTKATPSMWQYWRFKQQCKSFLLAFNKLLDSGYDNTSWIEILKQELKIRDENGHLFAFLLKYELETIPEFESDHIKITLDLTSYWRLRNDSLPDLPKITKIVQSL